MKISKPMTLGKSLKGHNVRARSGDGDNEGDAGESVAGREVTLSKIILTEKQFNFFAGEDAYRRHYDLPKGKPPKWLENYRKIPISGTYTDCAANLIYGLSKDGIELKDAVKIKNLSIRIDEKSDVPTLTCTLQASFPRKLETLDLENYYGEEIRGWLKFGSIEEPEDKSQGDLDLASEEDDEGDEESETPARRRNTDQPTAH